MTVEELRERIAAAETAHQAMDGLLFHGTLEAFDGPPRPNAGDGVLWTARTPAVAQSYIARSGVTLYGQEPSAFERQTRPRPAPGQFWHLVARAMGKSALDVETDAWGEPVSWRLPADYPTHEEAEAWLRGQGYEPSRGAYEVQTVLEDGVDKIMPAQWRAPGRLFVSGGGPLRLFDYAAGREGDLQDLDYHRLDLFSKLENEGFDGVIIHDFLQSKNHGNVGHLSVGLFARAADRMEWVETPAVNHDWDEDLTVSLTPAFEALWSELKAMPAPGM